MERRQYLGCPVVRKDLGWWSASACPIKTGQSSDTSRQAVVLSAVFQKQKKCFKMLHSASFKSLWTRLNIRQSFHGNLIKLSVTWSYRVKHALTNPPPLPENNIVINVVISGCVAELFLFNYLPDREVILALCQLFWQNCNGTTFLAMNIFFRLISF